MYVGNVSFLSKKSRSDVTEYYKRWLQDIKYRHKKLQKAYCSTYPENDWKLNTKLEKSFKNICYYIPIILSMTK